LEQAEELLTKSLALFKENKDIRYNLGNVYFIPPIMLMMFILHSVLVTLAKRKIFKGIFFQSTKKNGMIFLNFHRKVILI